jgi:hypothetical protein
MKLKNPKILVKENIGKYYIVYATSFGEDRSIIIEIIKKDDRVQWKVLLILKYFIWDLGEIGNYDFDRWQTTDWYLEEIGNKE